MEQESLELLSLQAVAQSKASTTISQGEAFIIQIFNVQ